MIENKTILLIDDDLDFCEATQCLLKPYGYQLIVIHNSEQIADILKKQRIDLILLDIILPGGKDGITLCQLIRTLTPVPIIMLTGIAADIEKVMSLEMGADNYITKPFNGRVLLAQIKACLRRTTLPSGSSKSDSSLISVDYQIYEFNHWHLNLNSHILIAPEGKIVKITSSEFSLLEALLKRPQCVFSRDQLLTIINLESEAFDRSIDIIISRLRAKLKSEKIKGEIIHTIRNSGYMLSCCVNKKTMNSKEWNQLIRVHD